MDGIRANYQGGVKDITGLNVNEMVDHYPEGTMWGVLPAWGLYVRHVDDLTIRNFSANWSAPDQRPAVILDDVNGLSIDGFQPATATGAAPLLWLNNVAGALIRGSRPVASPLFLRVSGRDSRGIVLSGNDLLGCERPVELQDAAQNALTLIGNAANEK